MSGNRYNLEARDTFQSTKQMTVCLGRVFSGLT
jgi:hypothetical protein